MVGTENVGMVMHAVELADVVWSARGRHREHATVEKEEEEHCARVDECVSQLRLENQKLQELLHNYEDAIQKELERQGSARTLEESYRDSCECSPDLYSELKSKLESPAFLQNLKDAARAQGHPPDVMVSEEGVVDGAGSEDSNWWLLVDDDGVFDPGFEEKTDSLGPEGYVVVNQEDFVDGIANFLAKYVSSIPETKKMTPEQLQKTILKAFNHFERKGTLRKMWEAAKMLYTATSWGASVFGLYRHPVVVKAASMAVWTSCTLIVALLK